MLSSLRRAREHVAALRGALVSPSPEEIERFLPALVEAAACLGSVQHEIETSSTGVPELREELHALKSELALVQRLIEHGATFYQGWARLLGSATGGYTPSGESAPLTGARTISAQG